MADQFTPTPVKTKTAGDVAVKLVDSGGTNQGAISAAGALKVEFGSAQAVSGTVTAGQGTAAAGSGAWPIAITNTSDTVVKPGDSVNNAVRVNIVAGSSAGTQYAEDAALGAAPTGTLAIGRRDDALSTLTPVEGDAVGLLVNNRGALWVAHDGTLTVSGTVTANAGTGTMAVSGTVTANAGTGVFDVTPASPAANDYLPVRITDGTNFLGTSGNPVNVTVVGAGGTVVDSGHLTTVGLAAAGGTTTFDSADIANASTGRLVEITASSSVRIKVEVGTWNGSVLTVRRTFFVDANDSWVYQPVEETALTLAGTAGTDTFRIRITNMDNASAADVYASITHKVV